MKFPIPSYSHSGEDRLIWKLCGYAFDGFYVDVGCYHPVNYSNTYLLYQAGWRGLAVDADPQPLDDFRRLRPRDTVVHSAVGTDSGTAVLHLMADRSMNTLCAEYALNARGTLAVPIRPLAEILADHGITRFEVLNVDVEGRDLDVLESSDWSRWRPDTVAVEDHQPDLEACLDSPVSAFLRGRGYSLHSRVNYTSIYREERL